MPSARELDSCHKGRQLSVGYRLDHSGGVEGAETGRHCVIHVGHAGRRPLGLLRAPYPQSWRRPVQRVDFASLVRDPDQTLG